MEDALSLYDQARTVWFDSGLGFLAHSNRNMDIWESWKILTRSNDEDGGLEGPNLVSMALTTWWAVWKPINNFIFNSIPICPTNTIRLI